MQEEHLSPKQKSVVITTLIVMLVSSSFVIADAHAFSYKKYAQRQAAGTEDGSKACDTSPTQVYNYVHSTTFLRHTEAYRMAYINQLSFDGCQAWIYPGGPQAQHVIPSTVDKKTLTYTNNVPSIYWDQHPNGSKTIESFRINDITGCAVHPRPDTCLDVTDFTNGTTTYTPTNWEITSSK